MLVILPSNSYLSGKWNGVKVIDTYTYFFNGYRSEIRPKSFYTFVNDKITKH